MSERYFRITDTPLPVLTEPDQRRLLAVAEHCEEWFANRLAGNAKNGVDADIFLGRELTALMKDLRP